MAEKIHVSEEELKKIAPEKYEKKFSEDGFWNKIKKNAAQIGVKVLYQALQLYYVTKQPNCPTKVKVGIYGALGYLISPIDVISDFIPLMGYTDDASVIASAIVLAQLYITEDVRRQAKEKIRNILGAAYADQLG